MNRDVEQHIKEHRTTRESMAIFAGYDLVAEPGTRYSYSSYGYNLLGASVPYGVGWQIPPFRERGSLVTNDGGQQETRTFILYEPERHLCMALAINLEADVYGPIVLELYRAITGRTPEIER